MSSNPNYKPSEVKREEFRKYLEKTGVMDALTKALVALYEEPDKPEDAIEFICNKLVIRICGESLVTIRDKLAEAEAKLAELVQESETPEVDAETPQTVEGEGEVSQPPDEPEEA